MSGDRRAGGAPGVLLCSCLLACAGHESSELPPVEVDRARIDEASGPAINRWISEIHERPTDAEPRVALGSVYEQNRMLHAAEACFAQAVELEPDEPRWRYYLALSRARRGQFDTALADLAEVLALEPSYAPAHVRRGDWQLELDDTESADQAFERALELDPQNVPALVGRARVLLKTGRPIQAAELLERLPATARSGYLTNLLATAYRQAGRDEQVLAVLRRVSPERKLPPLLDPWQADKDRWRTGFDVELRRVNRLIAAGHDDEAIALMEPLVEDHPSHVGLTDSLARAYARAGRSGDAVSRLKLGLEEAGENVDLLLTLAELYREGGRPNLGLAPVERALGLSPYLAKAHLLRGDCLIDLGRVDEARAAYAEALRHDPQNAQAHYTAGVISAGLGDHGAALRQFERSVELDPELGSAWLALARVRVSSGATAEAAMALERARKLTPDHPWLAEVERELATTRSQTP